jgi:hypothetical protein
VVEAMEERESKLSLPLDPGGGLTVRGQYEMSLDTGQCRNIA